MIRFGLCCAFLKSPIHFRHVTLTYLKKLKDQKRFLSEIYLDNANALYNAILCCNTLGIQSFRVNSQIFPLFTHPEIANSLELLPLVQLKKCKQLVKNLNFRLTFHPDQFVVLNSPNQFTVEKSIQEIEYQALVADLILADVINIHCGGVYGEKQKALKRFEKGFKMLSLSARKKLTLENDDKSYTPSDLLPLCRELKIPFVYDVHHHRCFPDGLSEDDTSELALQTWDREPLFHISSPLNGWGHPSPFKHSDYIDFSDFPKKWLQIDPLTVEEEAKAKELAVLKLMKEILPYY